MKAALGFVAGVMVTVAVWGLVGNSKQSVPLPQNGAAAQAAQWLLGPRPAPQREPAPPSGWVPPSEQPEVVWQEAPEAAPPVGWLRAMPAFEPDFDDDTVHFTVCGDDDHAC